MSKKGSSASQPENLYTNGEIVLAKIKGYPSWPGQIIDNDNAPQNVKREKPTKAKTYLVRFFPTGDYAWTAPRDLVPLTPTKIQSYIASPGKKSGDLLTGYKIAADPSEWLKEREEEAAAVEAHDDEDQLASGDDASGSKPSKKRKAPASKKELADEKNAKKAKLEKMAKSRAPASAAKKAEKAKAESSSNSKKAKSAPAPPPVEVEDPGLKQVRDWRHKLQKVFLAARGPINAEEMPKCREYFDAMETFDMKKEWLVETKLAKVLKRIVLLKDGEIPDEDNYKFRDRSTALAQKWTNLGGSSTETPKENGAEPSDAQNQAAPSTETPNDSTAPATTNSAEEAKDEKKMEGVTEHTGVTNGDVKTDAPSTSAAPEPVAA